MLTATMDTCSSAMLVWDVETVVCTAEQMHSHFSINTGLTECINFARFFLLGLGN